MNDIHLNLYGPGILIYSPYAAERIAPHTNFLESGYSTPAQVLPCVYEGSLVAFQTGDGFYRLQFRQGYPTDQMTHMLRLGILVANSTLCIRDLDDLCDWNPECPLDQQLKLEDGYYHLTVCSEGDFSQNEVDLFIYLHRLEAMPILDFRGNIPVLF